jgi:hypothetical protein
LIKISFEKVNEAGFSKRIEVGVSIYKVVGELNKCLSEYQKF